MKTRSNVLIILVLLVVADTASADTKIVKTTFRDKVLEMASTRAATEEESVIFVAEDRLRIDSGKTTMIVRLDEEKMHLVNHEAKTTSEVALPVDLAALIPEGASDKMLKSLTFTAKVTPTEMIRTIGSWKARRYDMQMTSSMVRIESKVWAVEEPGAGLDPAGFTDLYAPILGLQPGMTQVIEEMRKIKGFEVARESVMLVSIFSDNSMCSSEKVQSIVEIEAPEGTYDPPADYELQPFDFMAMMGGR